MRSALKSTINLEVSCSFDSQKIRGKYQPGIRTDICGGVPGVEVLITFSSITGGTSVKPRVRYPFVWMLQIHLEKNACGFGLLLSRKNQKKTFAETLGRAPAAARCLRRVVYGAIDVVFYVVFNSSLKLMRNGCLSKNKPKSFLV